MLASFGVFILPPLLFALCTGFSCSAFALYIGWSFGPIVNQNNVICFLGIALGVSLWIVMLLPLFEVSISANNLDDLERFLLYLVLFGATPLAAFPALFLFGPGKKRNHEPK